MDRSDGLLFDVQVAGEKILRFTRGLDFDAYRSDEMVRSAVERQFEIIGEALNQLSREAPNTAAAVTEHRRIIAFRNILIHGYAQVDDRLVWSVTRDKLPVLLQEVAALLEH